MANDLVVVDLSHWNTVLSFADAKAAGLIGIIQKATEGTGYVDDTFVKNRDGAKAAGLAFATYHFLKHGSVDAQMTKYLDTVNPVAGERVCIDYEDAAVTLDDLRAAVKILFADSRNLQVTVYSGHLIKDQLGGRVDELLAKTSLWIAQYTAAAAPTWPTGTWPAWSLWQYSDGSQGGSPRSIAGFKTPHDCNAFNGSRSNCLKWFGPASAQPQPEPEPEPEPDEAEARVEITTTPGVKVSVIVNGEPVG